MEGFFDQARRNLADDSSATLEREWKGKVRVVATGQPRIPAQVSATVFDTVSEALYANRWLSLDYRNSAGKESTVEVMPLGWLSRGRSSTSCADMPATTTSGAWRCTACKVLE